MTEQGKKTTDFMTCDQVPESWHDRCTDNGYPRYIDEDGNRRYADNDRLVSDMPFRPCARCGHYPNEDGDDWCIQRLGRVVNACCGHGTHDGYVMFDDGTTLRGRFTVERPKEPLPRTNYDKYFGTPEKAARQVVKCKENIIDTVSRECGVEAGKKVGRVYEDVTKENYLDWLKEESECQNRPSRSASRASTARP